MTIPAPPAKVRLRYPFRAIVVVGLAASFSTFNLFAGSLFLMPIIPLIPAFVVLMIGNASLLSSAVAYARSVATPLGEGFEHTKTSGTGVNEPPKAAAAWITRHRSGIAE